MVEHKVVIACGSGIAISKMIAFKVRSLLEKKNLFVKLETIAIKDLEEHIPSSIAYIAIFKPEKEYNIPIIDGAAFLTGAYQEELEKLSQIIQSAQCLET